jgi:hypothetical protein
LLLHLIMCVFRMESAGNSRQLMATLLMEFCLTDVSHSPTSP